MRVVYVTPGLGGGGGAERSLASMTPHWKDIIDLHVVNLGSRDALAPLLSAAGATVVRIEAGGRRHAIDQLRGYIKRVQPDLVHSVLFDADLVARLATPRRIPVSCSLVNVNYGPEQWAGPGRSRWKFAGAQIVDALSSRRVARFHALSAHVARVMAHRLAIPQARIDVIPRGRDRAEVGFFTAERRVQAREQLGIHDDRPLVVAAARHERQKGLDVLLAAMPALRSRFPDLAVVIGGRSGLETPHLRSQAFECGLDPDAVFIGPRDDVPDLMCAADAFCVPSRWEGLGSILIEAMALGAPVVAADLAPFRELDPTGHWLHYFPPGNSSELARTVGDLLGATQDAARGEWATSHFAKRYSAQHIAAEMHAFFLRAISSSIKGR